MKFYVQRASGKKPPCENVKTGKEEFLYTYGRFIREVYTIEINTLADLLVIIEKYGDIIIREAYPNDNDKTIIIYDDYIE